MTTSTDTVTIDRSLLRQFIVEALAVDEIAVDLAGVTPAPMTADLQRLALEVGETAGIGESCYLFDGNNVGPRWQEVDADARREADAFFTSMVRSGNGGE